MLYKGMANVLSIKIKKVNVGLGLKVLTSNIQLLASKLSGGNSPGVTPVPIPNTMVKPGHADGTILETVWKSRSLPDKKVSFMEAFLFWLSPIKVI